MRTSEQINELATALAKAQGQIQPAMKDTANTFFKSKYADLAACWDACRKPLSDNGLSVVQLPSTDGATVRILTRLMHSSGQWVEEELTLTSKDTTPQGILSCITYGRRGSLSAIVGIAPDDDDDGNQASGRDTKKSEPTKKQEPPKTEPPKPPEPCKEYEHLRGVMKNLGCVTVAHVKAVCDVVVPFQVKDVEKLKHDPQLCDTIRDMINLGITNGTRPADMLREKAGIKLDKPEPSA